jgi:UDP-glucose 4-epimerase
MPSTHTRISQVAHLVAVTGSAVTRDPHRVLSVDVLGTVNVLDAALAVGVDHVVCEFEGHGRATHRLIHTPALRAGPGRPPTPNNAYGISKWCVVQLAARYATERGLGITSIRLATLFGPGKAGLGGFGFTSALVERVRTGEPIEVTGADQRNDLLYVENMAQAVTAALDRPASGYWMVQIGYGTATSLAEFVEALHSVMPGSPRHRNNRVDDAGRGVGSYYPLRRRAGR